MKKQRSPFNYMEIIKMNNKILILFYNIKNKIKLTFHPLYQPLIQMIHKTKKALKSPNYIKLFNKKINKLVSYYKYICMCKNY
jgi:hypothetical protein